MSKATQTPHESGLSGQITPPEPEKGEPFQQETPGAPPEPDRSRHPKQAHEREKPKGSKVHRLSHEQDLYTPKKRERKTPALLTVEQYLRKTQQDKAISDLIRSLHKTKIMSFVDWEHETSALLKKKTW